MERPASGTAALLERLLSFSRQDGGLPYYRGNSPSAEPTFLAALALFASGAPAERAKPLLSWAQTLQNMDGSVSVDPGHRGQGLWLTAQAAIVFHHYGLKENLKRAQDFLLTLRSVTVANDPRFKQDNTLAGWPWVPGTFGWVEPTAWSLIALHLSGQAGHPRAVEGRKLLLDRRIPSGGWNYGNPNLDDKELLPFWDTTGLALTALCGQADIDRLRPSLDLVEKRQDKIESLCGLAWAVICLQAYGRDAGRLRTRLQNVMGSIADEGLHTGNFALGLIALSGKKVFTA
ncbi:MAG TPA: prenyltransferase/squalene oxidase repeat-containing protein [Acidobacteriota bacterium]|nr:prenyltransferase/squalene oxidase repeat-containing protein [Acidobacteriota bacterium]